MNGLEKSALGINFPVSTSLDVVIREFKATGSLSVESSLIGEPSKGSLLLQAISRKNGKNKKN